jgi:hypothetical protein
VASFSGSCHLGPIPEAGDAAAKETIVKTGDTLPAGDNLLSWQKTSLYVNIYDPGESTYTINSGLG